MKTLPAQRLRQQDWAGVEPQVQAAFRRMLFGPVVELLRRMLPLASKELANIGGDENLKRALAAGRVQYNPAKGEFTVVGSWNRKISSELLSFGAKFDKRSSSYRCGPAQVPAYVRTAAAEYNRASEAAHKELDKKLAELEAEAEKAALGIEIDAGPALRSIEQGWRAAAKGLEIPPELDEAGAKAFADRYAETLRKTILDQTKAQIAKLRELVRDNAEQGYRADRLAAGVRDQYAMSRDHARFIAKQETSNLMADFREARFREVGVLRYKWSCSGDSRVRPDHKKLHGKVFLYSQPPVVDAATGRRANPGHDFGCRCVDLPVLEAVPA